MPTLTSSNLGLPCVECVELGISPRVVAWIGENNGVCAERHQVVQTHEHLPPSNSGLFSSPSLQVAHCGAREVRSPFQELSTNNKHANSSSPVTEEWPLVGGVEQGAGVGSMTPQAKRSIGDSHGRLIRPFDTGAQGSPD